MRQARTLICATALFSAFAAAVAAAPAQEAVAAEAKLPVFDVVSIKPTQSNGMMIRVQMVPDGVSVMGMPMHMILRESLGVTNDRLFGEPGWVNAERYDIEAKVAPEDAGKLKGLTPQQRWEMLRQALEERCGLKYHHETRDLTVYALIVAKGGLKMQPSKAADPTEAQAAPGPVPGPGPGQRKVTEGVGDKGLTMNARDASLASIARMLSMPLGSTVVDKTGLTGTYDFSLEFAPDDSIRGNLPPPPGAPPEDGAGSQGQSIFSAVQEQLGLKLEAQKEPADVIVIDHLDKPTAN